MSQSFYPLLLAAGVKIYEYTPGFVHAKGCIIDDAVGTVGTVNLDYRSLFLHFENNALFYKASLLADLRADFLATQAQCREMRLGGNVRVGVRAVPCGRRAARAVAALLKCHVILPGRFFHGRDRFQHI